ncbi:DUF1330 domain-containing protein [Kribbella sandramycini]|uniref:DUF1330 domain-containing protein n=1 Tax=Kribbella sandramycini TaxID=60450 RepID=A0A7Y4L1A2_9ACTN|nr:DUF1330 domain-containing protein [Kribbella sandramycini]MBB6565162.1 uncharacterized protein (DUF1330 family) [Kribbella sandramycini]NOL41431.1 DUF1330 domain-containing protein [Kribbella sandramycini]
MTHYAIANLRNVVVGADIVEYLQRIDATLAPYDGHFVVHGHQPELLEGEWDGTLIVIEFPDLASVRGWYDSAAYQEILPLRTANSDGVAMIVEGVDRTHRATDVLATS